MAESSNNPLGSLLVRFAADSSPFDEAIKSMTEGIAAAAKKMLEPCGQTSKAPERSDELLEVIEPLFLSLEGKPIDAKHRAAIAARLNGTPPRYLLHSLQRKLQSGRKFGSGLWPDIAGESAEAWHKLSDVQRAPYLKSDAATVEIQTRPDPVGPAEASFADAIRVELERRLTTAQFQNHFTRARIVGWENSEVILWLPDDLSRQLIEVDDNVLSVLADAAGATSTRLIVGES